MYEIIKFGRVISFKWASAHPDQTRGMQVNNSKLWVNFNSEWFMPAAGFNRIQIEEMIKACDNDHQLNLLFKMLQSDN